MTPQMAIKADVTTVGSNIMKQHYRIAGKREGLVQIDKHSRAPSFEDNTNL